MRQIINRRIAAQAIATTVGAGLIAAASASTASAATPKLPVIKEKFHTVACVGTPSSRTVAQETACIQNAILVGDRTINALDKSIFVRLPSVAEKTDFVAGYDNWFNYRNSYCYSMADPYESGTHAPIVYGRCQLTVNAAHAKELRTFLASVK